MVRSGTKPQSHCACLVPFPVPEVPKRGGTPPGWDLAEDRQSSPAILLLCIEGNMADQSGDVRQGSGQDRAVLGLRAHAFHGSLLSIYYVCGDVLPAQKPWSEGRAVFG